MEKKERNAHLSADRRDDIARHVVLAEALVRLGQSLHVHVHVRCPRVREAFCVVIVIFRLLRLPPQLVELLLEILPLQEK